MKDILIPSEEHKIHVYPMDYEEFLWATGGTPDIIRKAYESNVALGNAGTNVWYCSVLSFYLHSASEGCIITLNKEGGSVKNIQ